MLKLFPRTAPHERAFVPYELWPNFANFATCCLTAKNILVFVFGRRILENHCLLTTKNIFAFVFGNHILENY